MELLSSAFTRGAHADTAILQALGNAGIKHEEFSLTNDTGLRGRDEEELTTRVAIIGDPEAKHRIWITTGIHGIERYCGTVYLCWLLENAPFIKRLLGKECCLVLVDNITPWGSSWHSRVNEENSDTNRSFRKRWPKRKQYTKSYAAVDEDLNPESLTLMAECMRIGRLLAHRMRKGDAVLQRMMNIGQWVHKDKMLYVGSGPTWSTLTTREIIRQYSYDVPGHDVHIDIHSGLGPSIVKAEAVLITIYDPKSPDHQRAKEFFGPALFSTKEDNPYTSSSAGVIENAFFDELPATRTYTGVCAELGSKWIVRAVLAVRWRNCVLKSLREGRADRNDTWTAQTMLNVFYPRQRAWRDAIVPRMNTVLYSALARINSL